MGKTRYLFKKIRDTKGIFHAKIGTIKDRNGMDLTEAKNIKKRWQEYTDELEKKDDPINHDGVITYLEPDILECEVKWGLRKHDQHMTNLDSILKSRDITLPTKVHLVKAMVYSSSRAWM